jgi:hypothetical protein
VVISYTIFSDACGVKNLTEGAKGSARVLGRLGHGRCGAGTTCTASHLQTCPCAMIGKPLAALATAGSWSFALNLASSFEFDVQGKVVACKELADLQQAKEPNVRYRHVNSVRGEERKTFPENIDERMMNAHFAIKE